MPGQSGPGSEGNKGLLCIPQSFTGTSLLDYLVSYPGHSLGGGLTPLQRCSRCILQPQPTGQANIVELLVLCPCRCNSLFNIFTYFCSWLESAIFQFLMTKVNRKDDFFFFWDLINEIFKSTYFPEHCK